MIANYVKAVLICLCALGMANNSVAQTSDTSIKNIVLVHGAWADGSGWKGVYEILVKDGYNVSVVHEPETSFKDDVAATKRALALQDGPCILVAHSYGGAVITEAGTDPSVVGLVYVAAHMPDTGENEADDGKRFPSDLAKSGAIKKTPDGFTYIDPGQFHSDDHHGRMAKQTQLDGGGRKRSNDQPGLGTLVCQTCKEPHGRSRRRQSLRLHISPEGGCSSDRRC